MSVIATRKHVCSNKDSKFVHSYFSHASSFTSFFLFSFCLSVCWLVFSLPSFWTVLYHQDASVHPSGILTISIGPFELGPVSITNVEILSSSLEARSRSGIIPQELMHALAVLAIEQEGKDAKGLDLDISPGNCLQLYFFVIVSAFYVVPVCFNTVFSCCLICFAKIAVMQ
jgi:hypothetical protein